MNFIKDIGYVLRSPLILAVIVAALWSTYIAFESINIGLILLATFLGLLFSYFVAFLTSKFFEIPSFNKLPRLLRYYAVYILVLTLGFEPLELSNLTIWDVLRSIPFAIWVYIATLLMDVMFSTFFYDTNYKKEWAFSFGMISWFITLFFIYKYELLWGILLGLLSLILLPFIITGLVPGLIQRVYTLMGIRLYIIDENKKWSLNPQHQRKSEKDETIQRILSDLNTNEMTNKANIKRKLGERLDHLNKIKNDLKTFDFDNNELEYRTSIAEYIRWRTEIVSYLTKEINRHEANQLFHTFSIQANSLNIKYDSVEKEIISIRGYLLNLIKALNEGKINTLSNVQVSPKDKKDVFISHASEDKKDYVEPLINKLQLIGITFWYDNAELRWGDSLVINIEEGLKHSKFVIVILSKNFQETNWAKYELDAALNMEFSSGKTIVLPILVGTDSEVRELLNDYPFIASKKYLNFNIGLEEITNRLLERIR